MVIYVKIISGKAENSCYIVPLTDLGHLRRPDPARRHGVDSGDKQTKLNRSSIYDKTFSTNTVPVVFSSKFSISGFAKCLRIRKDMC